MTRHQIFGSKSSTDYDIMVFVDKITTIQESHEIVSKLDKEFSEIYSGKPTNCNLAIVGEDGTITKVFKGTSDEVNNALLETYDFHDQKFPQIIKGKISRDVNEKILRTARVLLSFLSRTEHRKIVKAALKGDLSSKLDVLSIIDLSKITDLGSRNVEWVDYIKTMSFQLGQTNALIFDTELYTKESISKYFPKLSGMLDRTREDLEYLESMKIDFVKFGRIRFSQNRGMIEKDWGKC